jgi:hypothetical protein
MYMGATVKFNFGPKFKYPPKEITYRPMSEAVPPPEQSDTNTTDANLNTASPTPDSMDTDKPSSTILKDSSLVESTGLNDTSNPMSI